MDRMAILAKTQKRHEGKSERGGGYNNPPPPPEREGIDIPHFANFYSQLPGP